MTLEWDNISERHDGLFLLHIHIFHEAEGLEMFRCANLKIHRESKAVVVEAKK